MELQFQLHNRRELENATTSVSMYAQCSPPVCFSGFRTRSRCPSYVQFSLLPHTVSELWLVSGSFAQFSPVEEALVLLGRGCMPKLYKAVVAFLPLISKLCLCSSVVSSAIATIIYCVTDRARRVKRKMEYVGGKFQGIYVFGRFDGNGTYEFPDGTRYVGSFRNGQFHGKGTLHFPQGRYEATWQDGQVRLPCTNNTPKM